MVNIFLYFFLFFWRFVSFTSESTCAREGIVLSFFLSKNTVR